MTSTSPFAYYIWEIIFIQSCSFGTSMIHCKAQLINTLFLLEDRFMNCSSSVTLILLLWKWLNRLTC